MNWLSRTFSDVNGEPSFKRQGAALLILSLITFTAIGKEAAVLAVIGGVIGTVLTASVFERKNK